MSAALTLDLPLPPSANKIWRAGRRRVYRSAAYLRWLKSAGWELVTQRPAPFPAGTAIALLIRAGKARRGRDADNLAKPIGDLLQKHAIVSNDRDITDIRVVWDASVEPGRVQIEARAIERRAA